MRLNILLVLFCFSSVSGLAQPIELRKDLRDHWKVIEGDHLEDYNGQAVHAIHFNTLDQFKGGIIAIKAPAEFAVFVNGQLQIRTRTEIRLNIDSLLAERSGISLLSIFQDSNVKTLQTELISKASLETENFIRQSTHFNDFAILTSLFLFGFFVILFRSNTRLTIDYLNLIKVFSIKEREEAIITGRIGASVNILFFVFISMLCSLLLIIIFNWGPPVLYFSNRLLIKTTSQAFVLWIIVTIIILIFLVMKLLLIWSMNSLFGFKGVVRFQFFNFIRSLHVLSVLLSIGLLFYFMIDLRNPDFFYFLLASASGFMILSAFFLYFKLMTRTSSTVFHLFSYLCGSEIIPLMILLKVLLN